MFEILSGGQTPRNFLEFDKKNSILLYYGFEGRRGPSGLGGKPKIWRQFPLVPIWPRPRDQMTVYQFSWISFPIPRFEDTVDGS